MKTTITLPVSTVPLFIRADRPVRSASDIFPFPGAGVPVTADEESPDERLGGDTTVVLFEHEAEIDAFAAGVKFMSSDDDWTSQAYILTTPIERCGFALVIHCSDGDDGLHVGKYAEKELVAV